MREALIWLGVIILIIAAPHLASLAQTVLDPMPIAGACAYNTSAPTLTSGTFGYVQCSSSSGSL